MSGSSLTPKQERALFRLANRQRGVLRLQQLLDGGLTQDMIDWRVRCHRLTVLHPGVYAFGHTALRPEARWQAAAWAYPAEALSHASASDFYGWTAADPDAPVHLSTLRHLVGRDGLAVHRVATLDRVDVHRMPGAIRVTSQPRTLVDLADTMDWAAFRELADRQRHLDLHALRRAQGRAPNRVGRGRVSRLIEADDAHTRSEFERRFVRFVTAHHLPRPDEMNVRVASHLADCLYRTPRPLVVELDGRSFHDRRSAMRADRRRDADYQLAGNLILRYVWDDLHPDSAAAAADRLRRFLALASGGVA